MITLSCTFRVTQGRYLI